jgi:hypothetical protein
MMKLFNICLVALFILLYASLSYAGLETKYGADFRLRYEFWENAFAFGKVDLKDENFTRLKSSLWGELTYNENFGAYAKVSTEPKYYWSSFSNDNRYFQQDEIFFESLYLDLKRVGGLPVDFRIGRQDLKYGDGFLIWDGTPGSGDRTKYFNAAKATWRINQDHSLDFVYIYAPMTDTVLPSIHPAITGRAYKDNKRILNTSDSQAALLYGKSKVSENMTMEPYYIFKREDAIDANNPILDLHTIGARGVYKNGPWEVKGEFAHQFGEYANGRERRGNGGNIFINRALQDVLWEPRLEAGFIYMSGDDPSTAAHEGWDPLFSRWPGISRLYIYAYARETGIIAYWTNLELFRADVRLKIAPETTATLFYNYLMAAEKTKVTGPFAPIFSNDGRERGHLWQAVLNQKFTANIDSTLMFEYFIPGNFYGKGAEDALFLRWEMQFRI